jgi:hypothetical protein
LYKKLDNIQNSIDRLPPVLIQGVGTLLEEKGVAAGNITVQLLEDTMKKLFMTVGLSNAQHSQTGGNNEGRRRMVHCYDGRLHLVPKSFKFPEVGVFGAWKLWWFGDESKGYPPLRRIRSHDLPNNLQKTFSDWSVMMKHIITTITSSGVTIPDEVTEEHAVELFGIGMRNLRLAPSSRKRRFEELSLSTVLRLVRQAKHNASL